MKLILLTLLLLAGVTLVKAQSDSATIKLQQYKSWFDQSLITRREYDQLRSKVIDVRQPVPHAKYFDPDRLHNQYKRLFISGSVCLGTGAVLLAASVPFIDDGVKRPNRTRHNNGVALLGGIVGMGLMYAGVPQLIVAGVKLHKYRTQHRPTVL